MKEALIIVDIQQDVAMGAYRDAARAVYPYVESDPNLVVAVRRAEAKLHPKIKKWADVVATLPSDPPPYSAFTGGTLRPLVMLEDILEEEGIDVIRICGIVRPYRPILVCTALDANALGFTTHVIRDATIWQEGKIALAESMFKRAGVTYG